jgi:hypothetical protein
MLGRHRIIWLLCTLAIACGGGKKDVEHARHSQYDADFAIVYQAALEAVRELYPNLDDAPGSGKIKTAWHQVVLANQTEDTINPGTMTNGQGLGQAGATGLGGAMGAGTVSPGAGIGGMPTRLAFKRFYIRFDVAVVGGRPWRVKVVGHASSWDPGAAMPTELHGVAKPAWLEPRTDAVQVAIYKRIRQFAVPMKEEAKIVDPDENLPKTDPNSFENVPAGAQKLLAKIKDLLARRDYTGLRALLADDVVWSLGGEPSADTAMAMWQADPAAFEAMAAAVTAKTCTNDDIKRHVTCASGEKGWQLVIEPRGDAWKVTSFVKPE